MRKKSLGGILIILLMLITLGQNVYATDFSKRESIKEKVQEYSELYKKYLELSKEEKEKYGVIPSKYNIPMDVLTKKQKENNWLELIKSKITNTEKKIPSSYIILAEERMKDKNVKVEKYGGIDIKTENQGSEGLCWDFASLTSLESNLMLQKGVDLNFSENHINYLTSDNFGKEHRELGWGGNFSDFADYCKNLYGPVLEEECPYEEQYTKEEYEQLLNIKPKAYINEIMDFPSIYKSDYSTYTDEDLELFRKSVKEHIMKNGSIYAVVVPPYFEAHCYNTETKALYAPINTKYEALHAISIVGWDDNYSKDNFLEEKKPSKNGAYIAMNSWGEQTGFMGDEFFYISYEDFLVENDMHGVVSASVDKPECEAIKFKDENLYNAIKQQYKKNIISFNDDKKELQITKLALNDIQYIDLENKNIKDLNGIEKFTNITAIYCNNNNISNIEPLSHLEQLEYIYLNNNNIENIKALENLKNINTLELANNKIKDISYLKYLSTLIDLDISDNDISNISPLSKLEYLSYLRLDNTLVTSISDLQKLSLFSLSLNGDNILDLSVLSQMESLDSLELNNTNIKDITFLKNLNIEYLSLENNGINKISEINGLLELNGIYYLNVGNNNIQDFNGLEEMPQLVRLNISNNNIQDIRFLKDLTNLCDLNISNNKIENIDILVDLTDLDSLNISSNKIKNIYPLSDLTNIYDLNISNNEIENIDALENIHNLGLLDISNTSVTDISVLGNLENLWTLNMENTNAEDISVLKNLNLGEIKLGNKNVTDLELIEKLYNINVQCKEMKIEEQKLIEKNKETILELPELFSSAFYDSFYKENIEFECENCSVNFDASKIIIKQTELGKGKASIKMINKYNNEIIYVLDYNVVDKVEIYSIGLKNQDKTRNSYIEGESFETDNLQVFIIYENGMKEITNDYEIIGGENLKKEQENIIIRSTKNPSVEYEFTIKVYSKEDCKTIVFEDEYLYDNIKNKFSTIIEIEPIIFKVNDTQKSIIMLKSDINQIKDINLWLCNNIKNIKSLKGIENFTELKKIDLSCFSTLEDIESLFLLKKLEFVYLKYTPITDIENLIKKDSIQSIYMHYVEDEIKNINESNKNIELPKFVYDALTLQKNVTAKGTIYYETSEEEGERYVHYEGKTNDAQVKIDNENKKAMLKLDTEITEDKPKQIRGIEIEITGGKVEGTIYTAYYNMEQSSGETPIKGDLTGNNEIDQNDYIAILRHIATINGGGKEAWKLSEEQQKQADVTGDGIINLNDVLKIKRYIATKNDKNVAKKYPKWLEL